MATFKDNVTSLKEHEAQIRRGLGIFKIEQPPNKDIALLDKVLYNRIHIYKTGVDYFNLLIYRFQNTNNIL